MSFLFYCSLLRVIVVLFLCAALQTNLSYADGFPIDFVCNLSAPGPVDCNQLERGIANRWPSVNLRASLSEARARIEIISRNESGRRIYSFRGYIVRNGHYDPVPNIWSDRIINDGTPEATEILLVGAYAQQYAEVLFLDPLAPSEETNGQFVARYRLSEPQLGRSTSHNTNWYFAPKLSLSGGGGAGGLNASGNLIATTNYSTAHMRFRQNATLGYRAVRFMDSSHEVNASVFTFNGNFLFLRGLSPHVNVALTAIYNRNQAMNIDHSASGKATIEWIMVPFQQTLSHNFALRYSVGSLWNQYTARTTLNRESDFFVQNTLSASAFFHFAAADFSAGVAATTNLPRFDFLQLNFGAGVVLRPHPRVGISLMGSLGYLPQRYDAWVAPPSEDLAILNSFVGGFSEIVYGFDVGVTYVIGAEDVYRSDRRMSDFP